MLIKNYLRINTQGYNKLLLGGDAPSTKTASFWDGISFMGLSSCVTKNWKGLNRLVIKDPVLWSLEKVLRKHNKLN